MNPKIRNSKTNAGAILFALRKLPEGLPTLSDLRDDYSVSIQSHIRWAY